MQIIYKKRGETPLQALSRWKGENPHLAHEKLSYAGRLDPMAEGALLILIGDENTNRKAFERQSKRYRITITLGVETDSFDMLGVPVKIQSVRDTEKFREHIKRVLPNFLGTYFQQYPPYASVRVRGKPLFWWAHHGRLGEIRIPAKRVTISAISDPSFHEETVSQLWDRHKPIIQSVSGSFRQEHITAAWDQTVKECGNVTVLHVTGTVDCGSGTYMRTLARDVGNTLGTGGIASMIQRLMIGKSAVISP